MKIEKITKKNGDVVYKKRVYLGLEEVTQKRIYTTITALKKADLNVLEIRKKNEFLQNGNTLSKNKTNFETFGDVAFEWFENHYKMTVKESTVKTVKSFLDTYILPSFSKIRMEKLTTSMIQTEVNKWARNSTKEIKGTIRKKGNGRHYSLLLNYVKHICQYAVSLDIIKTNPCVNVQVPKINNLQKTEKEIKHFTQEELTHFIKTIKENKLKFSDYRHEFFLVLIPFLSSTGLRIGECLALDWSDIDFDECTLSVSKTLSPSNKVQNTPKTEKSKRVISIDKNTISLLKNWHAFQRKTFFSLGVRSNLIFCSELGKILFKGNLMLKLKQYFKLAKLHDIGFHGFRHTHASLLINSGIDYKIIQERLGHSSIATTLNTYSHISKESEKQAVELFEKNFNFM